MQNELSIVEPSFYAKRFYEFMSNNVVDTEGDATLVGSNFTSRRESDSEEDSVIEKDSKSSKDKKSKDKTRTRSDSA